MYRTSHSQRPQNGSSGKTQQLSLLLTLADQIRGKEVSLDLIPDYPSNMLNIKHLGGLDDDLLIDMYEIFLDFANDLESMEDKLDASELNIRSADDWYGNPTTEFYSYYTDKITWLENTASTIGKELDLRVAEVVTDNSLKQSLTPSLVIG